MVTKQPNLGTLLAVAIKLPWYMFVLSMKAFIAFLKWIKLPVHQPQTEEHRLNQAGAKEQVVQQIS